MSTKYVQAKRTVLRSSINDSATTCTLTGFLDLAGNPVVQADIGTTGYGTFEPNTDKEEAVSFTIDSNTSAGVAVLTITRGLLGKAPYGTGGTAFQHNAGSEFIISNNPNLLDKMTAKDNDEVVSGSWEFPTPTADASPATKQYVDENVSGGAVSQNRIVVAGTAGDTLAEGDLVYFDKTAVEWLKTAGATPATLNNVLLGIAQGAGIDSGAISGGVLTLGLDSTQTGMTPGAIVYAGDTAGSIVETPGTIERIIGETRSATEIYFDPKYGELPTRDEKDAMTGVNNLPTATNQFVTTDDLTDDLSVLATQLVTFTSSGTWTKDSGLLRVRVQAWGGGGGGNGNDGRGCGGGGGYSEKNFEAADLGATETVTVGSGGAVGSDGGNTTFGSLLTAYFGYGGGYDDGGKAGSPVSSGSDALRASGGSNSVDPEDGIYGGGGGYGVRSGGNSFWGGGGGTSSGTAGVSIHGGDGGASGVAGTQPGGGGGGNAVGGAGQVIVTEYYV